MISNENKSEVGLWSAISNASIMLPTLGTLLPLGVLIYVLIKVRPILQNNLNNLPPQFFWFNRLTFFLVVMQMFILSKFYNTVSTEDEYRGIWIASMILFSVLKFVIFYTLCKRLQHIFERNYISIIFVQNDQEQNILL